MSYADDKYGVISRKWFGLSKAHGGAAAAPFDIALNDSGTTTAHLARFYPKGPIKIVKWGLRVLGTASQDGPTATQIGNVPFKLLTRGASASSGGEVNLDLSATYKAQYSVASTETIAAPNVKAGEYLAVRQATRETAKGTEISTGTLEGTVAFFVDWVPTFSTKWDV